MKILGARPPLEGFLPRQFQRFLPATIGCIIFFILFHIAPGHTPYDSAVPGGRFPQKIWQIWKVDPTSFEQRDLDRARSWHAKNPLHRYEVLTDQSALNYVEYHFGQSGFNRPDIVHTYQSLNARIVKADLLRYLVMYAEGGIYADIDVEALKPLHYFIPDRFDERIIDMVVGVEIDEPDFRDHPILGPKSQSFCQWTFMCKPRLPVMMRLIDDILVWLDTVAKKQGKSISEIELDFDEVISGTGPSAFTSALLAEISASRGEAVTWDTFHDMTESKVVSGVLVLTVEAFAAGSGHSESGSYGGKHPLVKHHFHASLWPTNHPRFKHPMYGEVESCNWDAECVRLWDANTASFAAHSPQEQKKLIAMKEIEDARNLATLEVPPNENPPDCTPLSSAGSISIASKRGPDAMLVLMGTVILSIPVLI